MVADFNRLTEQAAGIAAQIEDQALQVREAVDRLVDFLGRGFLELGEVNVADAGADLVFEVDGGVRDLIADQVEAPAALTGPSRTTATWTWVPLGPLRILGDRGQRSCLRWTCRRWPR